MLLINGAGKAAYIYRSMKLDPYPLPYTKASLRWIKFLYLSPVTMKLLEENIGETVENIYVGDGFLDKNSKSQEKENQSYTKGVVFNSEVSTQHRKQQGEVIHLAND